MTCKKGCRLPYWSCIQKTLDASEPYLKLFVVKFNIHANRWPRPGRLYLLFRGVSGIARLRHHRSYSTDVWATTSVGPWVKGTERLPVVSDWTKVTWQIYSRWPPRPLVGVPRAKNHYLNVLIRYWLLQMRNESVQNIEARHLAFWGCLWQLLSLL